MRYAVLGRRRARDAEEHLIARLPFFYDAETCEHLGRGKHPVIGSVRHPPGDPQEIAAHGRSLGVAQELARVQAQADVHPRISPGAALEPPMDGQRSVDHAEARPLILRRVLRANRQKEQAAPGLGGRTAPPR